MIITRNWLNEWINLSAVSTDELCKTLNKIGLEVAAVTSYSVVDGCVVGFVKSRTPHPNAEKLSVCIVDVGQSEPLQIVCGAKNVREGQLVPVALVGCKLPNGLEIKEAELRGVKSCGMICSSSELGYPKTNDGIMVLDGITAALGTPLNKIADFNDDAIEIELTPNRGDCLSIYGVARDLSAVYNAKITIPPEAAEDIGQIGIGRVLNLNIEGAIDSSLIYQALRPQELKSSVIADLRLAMIGSSAQSIIDRHLAYATHSTGVILRAYKADALKKDKNDKITLTVKKDKNSLDAVWGKERLSYVGISQESFSKPNDSDELIILEASYADPTQIALNGARAIKNSDEALFRSLRGSEPNLAFGINYLSLILNKTSKVGILTGTQRAVKDRSPHQISGHFEDIYSIIGVEIPKTDIITILKNLQFDSVVRPEQNVLVTDIPLFRHDVENIQDICEEIVRIVGIDNIASSPLRFTEANRTNAISENFEKKKFYRHKATAAGFFESVHYIFGDREKQEFYGFPSLDEELEIANPITTELNTLRTTCALNLTQAASNNIKAGRKGVCLFELGKVFDSRRNERVVMTFIASGESERRSPLNHGKPSEFDFALFAQRIALVLGDFEIIKAEPDNKFYSPYEYGEIAINGKTAGYIARVGVEKEYDLGRTYICEVDFDTLPYGRKRAKAYSKLPSVSRDLSLLVPKELPYAKIANALKESAPKELKEFYPIDIYKDDSLGENESLTLTLVFEPEEKTFTESEINALVERVLEILSSELKVNIR
ncbi:MAG: phenylalanine--tRNA ligase subunit beta [Campylobacteraceae bacterium]|jgi:phenylalanyl-tRNA synthetase beta chain|nr:phenylalanine--tRNA ligase subunit beta [Campylobacteraceae bacterium]